MPSKIVLSSHRATSLALKISGEEDLGDRVGFGPEWTGTLEIVANGEVVYTQPFWLVDEFAISLKFWLDGGGGAYEYFSVEADPPILWLRLTDGDWILGTDLTEDESSVRIVALESTKIFRKAASTYWRDTLHRHPGLQAEYESLKEGASRRARG